MFLRYNPLAYRYPFDDIQNLTKYGIAFPRHATPIVKCFRCRCAYGETDICHVVDYKFGRFFCFIFAHSQLYLRYDP